ncbi:DnaD domain-containing protein [Paenibacillus eucommiae]|uniref:DNA replication protein n=1 Tax=Paenibacillus eucommiae TaxID=1355755 RepID=A0ABS4J6P3_9BACL|nr:DnaD domain protein [Paenibacillus eucommiae]MBP1994781.1 DNA replication protein [Paenibacillus eucommiae]
MKTTSIEQKHEQALLQAAMKEGTVAVPTLLLKYYKRLKLSELEAMILIQLIAFLDKVKNDFPTIEEIQALMSAAPEQVIAGIQRLLKEKFISIDEDIDEISGIQYERYNLDPLYTKLAAAYLEEQAAKRIRPSKTIHADKGKDIFSIIEKEFARPLTPMELEGISSWLDKDNYREELILAALKEAVFAGKVHFRYMDRILLEWSRNRVATVEQAKEFTQRFRNSR